MTAVLLATALQAIPAHASPALQGCWYSRDTKITNSELSNADCESGTYFHLQQTLNSFAVDVFYFQCKQNVAVFGKGGPYTVSGSSIMNQSEVVGTMDENTLSVNFRDPELDEFSETLQWIQDGPALRFTAKLNGPDKVLRELKGTLKKVRCLE